MELNSRGLARRPYKSSIELERSAQTFTKIGRNDSP